MSTSAIEFNRLVVPDDEPLAVSVEFSKDTMIIYLANDGIVDIPISYLTSLSKATEEQRANLYISAGGRGLHWPDIDEDLTVSGLVKLARMLH